MLSLSFTLFQNSTTLNELLQYQTEVQRIGEKVNDRNLLIKRWKSVKLLITQDAEHRKDTFDKKAVILSFLRFALYVLSLS